MDVGRWMSDQVKKLYSLDFGRDAINILERKVITTALGYKTNPCIMYMLKRDYCILVSLKQRNVLQCLYFINIDKFFSLRA